MNNSQDTIAEDTLWTVKDVAKYLRVSTSLVYKKAEAGEMPYLRLGAMLRFEPSAVRRWAVQGEAPSATIVPIKRGT